MYSKNDILKKQRSAAAIVIALDLILIYYNSEAEYFKIVTFNLAVITAFILWLQLLIIQAQEEEAKKKSIQPPIKSIRE